jgi:hypothetical protein
LISEVLVKNKNNNNKIVGTMLLFAGSTEVCNHWEFCIFICFIATDEVCLGWPSAKGDLVAQAQHFILL